MFGRRPFFACSFVYSGSVVPVGSSDIVSQIGQSCAALGGNGGPQDIADSDIPAI